MKNTISLLLFYLALTNSTINLFAQQKAYEVNEETSWSNFYLVDISNDKNWAYYNNSIHFVGNKASIKKMDSDKVFDFENGHTGKFSNNSKWFSIMSNNNTLNWVNLKTYRQDSLQNVKTAWFTTNANFLIAHNSDNDINVIDLNTGDKTIPGKSSLFSIRPIQDGVAMVFNTENGDFLKIIDFKDNTEQEVLKLPKVQFKRMTWNKKGDKLAFVFQHDEDKPLNLGLFDYDTKKVRFLNENMPSASYNDLDIADAEITLNDDGTRVFFRVKNTNIPLESSVEVWDTADPIMYSRKKFNYADMDTPRLNVWLDSGKVIPIETKKYSKSIWNPNTEYAIIYNPKDYEPQFNFRPFADLYILNLNNGSKQKIIDKQYTHGNYLKIAPKGNYLAYFRDNNWWIYDIKLDRHTNLTEGIPVRFDDEFLTNWSFPQPYGLSAWSNNEKEVYINDAYDIWKISVDGSQKQKLTNGRKEKLRHSIVDMQDIPKIVSNEYFMRIPVLQANNEIVLGVQSLQNYSSGFYILKPNGSLNKIAFKDKRLSRLFSLNNDSYIFQEESLNIPPSVNYVNLKTKREKTIVKSNKGWEDFKWPEKKLIQYSTHFADDLKGVLIYPVNYNPEKKYPMVVHIYEDSSKFYHIFYPPTHGSEIGFTNLNFALDDYFVLLPDIVYLKNKVGYSATQCVLSAIDKVLETEKSVDADKLGLIGHSFGGYETAFIITQTDRFKAAVAGNGIFNLYSNYFEYQKLVGIPEYLRIEKGQFRMKDTFFENKEAYIENSPIHHYDQVNTPLLIWAGKVDDNIDHKQSVQGYLALRRLQKPAVMYLYENEGHVIIDNNNQKDLTNRIKNWFDTYLK
ncbi:MAG: prolyl oligopeptidase family serine peptidase [Flavobacteriaceae bacterium]